jgi:hypothetical protein
MNLGLGDVLVGHLVRAGLVWFVRLILCSGLCGVIDVLMFEKLESA